MKRVWPLAPLLLPALVAIGGLVVLSVWLSAGSVVSLPERVPGLDRAQSTEGVATSSVPPVGRLTQGDGKPADLSGSWPRFRGEKFDNIGQPGVPLTRQWPSGGPKVLWSVELGEGHAGPVVQDGRVYLLDYDRVNSADAFRCLSLADGKEIWRFSYPVSIKRNHGMSRTVPVISGKRVVAMGPKCQVTCLDASSGQRQWQIDLARQYGATVPPWYSGQCPLVDRDRVILAPGGKDALLLAVDLATGNMVWKTPNPHGWKMTHSSIMPMEFRGRKMFVYCASDGVVGASAEDGSILWETAEWKISIATVPSPLCLPEGKIFFSGGYNSGALLAQLEERDGVMAPKSLARLKAGQFGSTQHTPIFFGGHIYGVREKDKELVCLDLKGKELWHSGPEHRFGIGPYLVADGLIYVMSDDGVLTMAEAVPTGYTKLGRAQVLDGHDAWGPMALVGGRLLVRDVTRMVCLDVSKQ
jgi:outer membrane protein assembly factor BamB